MRRTTMITITGLLALLALVLTGVSVQAQPKKDEQAGDQDKGDVPKVKVERGKGGKKVYRITQGFVIEGRIQKPNAFYVLQRSQINYDWADLKHKFVPRILEAVRKSPF
jgi:hypothetical protein